MGRMNETRITWRTRIGLEQLELMRRRELITDLGLSNLALARLDRRIERMGAHSTAWATQEFSPQ